MALSEFEHKRVEKIVSDYIEAKRPSPAIRAQVDLSFRLEGQSVEIFEIRPVWDDPTRIIEPPIAKATYVKTAGEWRIYWMRADMNWHRYEPHPTAQNIQEFLDVVEEDAYNCFWG